MKQGFRIPLRIKHTPVYLAVFTALNINSAYAYNSFADVPLHLQSTSTTTSSYSVKPNVTLLIDDSGSMGDPTTPESYKCKKKTRQKGPGGKWGSWSAASKDYVANFETKPKEPDDKSPENVYYDPCVKVSKMDVVKEVLTSLVQKHRNDLYFSLQPYDKYEGSSTEYKITDPSTNETITYDLERFYDTSLNLEYQIFLGQINGNKETDKKKLYGLRASGSTYTTSRYAAVARNIVMNKLRFRCQRSYVVLMTDGEEANNTPYSDSPLWGYFHRSGRQELFDGYFDGYRNRDDPFFDQYNVCQQGTSKYYLSKKNVNKLAYYTNTLATKSFGSSAIKLNTKDPIKYKENSKYCEGDPVSINQYDPANQNNAVNYQPYIYTSNYLISGGGNFASPLLEGKSIPRTTDEAGKPWNDWVDPKDPSKGRFKQVATTFTIGVGLGNKTKDAVIETLRNAATEADADSTKTDGNYKDSKDIPYDMRISPQSKNFFNANSRQEIIDAFNHAFDNIIGEVNEIQKPITTHAPNFATTTTESGAGVLTVRSTVDTSTWSSMLLIQKGTNPNAPVFKPSFNDGSRRFILSDGSHTYSYPNNLNGLSNNTFNIPTNDNNQNEWKDGLLAWLARAKPDSEIKQKNFVLDYRNRETIDTDQTNTDHNENAREMGDIIDNTIFITESHGTNLPRFIVTSTNEGLVYVFKSPEDNGNLSYSLAFNYMPLGMQRNSLDTTDTVNKYFKDLTQKDYGHSTKKTHRFLLNGGITVRETEDDDPLYFMASSMGQAGRGIFALIIGGKDPQSGLDVGADSSDDNVTLFHSPQDEDNKFGYTVGTPAIVRVRVDKTADENTRINSVNTNIRQAIIAGSGFNYPGIIDPENPVPDPTETALYVYDALGLDVGADHKPALRTGDVQGTRIAKIVVPEDMSPSGGLAAVRAISSHNNGVADIVYAGDYGGNMYRFDLRESNPAYWSVRKIFEPVAGDHSPITSAPEVYPYKDGQYIVTFGTGSEIYQSDLLNKDKQYMYGIYDRLDATLEQQPVRTRNSLLLDQEITQLANNKRAISDKQFSSNAERTGWYFALPDSGERVVQSPIVASNTLLFYTHSFSLNEQEIEDPCVETTSTSTSEIFTYTSQINVLTGGRVKENDYHFVWDANPLLMAIGSKGLSTIAFPNNGTNTNIGASGKEQKLGKIIDPFKHCSDVNIVAVGNGTNNGNVGHGGLCSVSIRHLSWREVFSNYTS